MPWSPKNAGKSYFASFAPPSILLCKNFILFIMSYFGNRSFFFQGLLETSWERFRYWPIHLYWKSQANDFCSALILHICGALRIWSLCLSDWWCLKNITKNLPSSCVLTLLLLTKLSNSSWNSSRHFLKALSRKNEYMLKNMPGFLKRNGCSMTNSMPALLTYGFHNFF